MSRGFPTVFPHPWKKLIRKEKQKAGDWWVHESSSFTGESMDRWLCIVIIIHLLTDCFKISPSLRTNQDCSSCETVSKKYVSNSCHQITNMIASTGKCADILKWGKVGFRWKWGTAVRINSLPSCGKSKSHMDRCGSGRFVHRVVVKQPLLLLPLWHVTARWRDSGVRDAVG